MGRLQVPLKRFEFASAAEANHCLRRDRFFYRNGRLPGLGNAIRWCRRYRFPASSKSLFNLRALAYQAVED